jgi:GAF domain-containing protein
MEVSESDRVSNATAGIGMMAAADPRRSDPMNAPVPHHERARLAALHRNRILDPLPKRDFDALAAQICGTPMALISLIDATRQWFTAKVGITAAETARDDAFCAHAIVQSDPLMVPDARLDSRFVDHPWVTGPPHIRFYAGAPLVTPEGDAIGTLCVLDRVPRQLTRGRRAIAAKRDDFNVV